MDEDAKWGEKSRMVKKKLNLENLMCLYAHTEMPVGVCSTRVPQKKVRQHSVIIPQSIIWLLHQEVEVQ